jgi:hypothetical protein
MGGPGGPRTALATGDEPLVVQVGVDLGELGREPLGPLGQQQLPDGGLRVGLPEHRLT